MHDLIRQLPKFEDDGRLVRTVGDWGAQKYLLALRYAEIVTTAMKGKWSRAYIDLFCGSGLVRLEDSREVVPGSPLLALSVAHPFDRYIFCDKDPNNIAVLRERVQEIAPAADVTYFTGDANERAREIGAMIPRRDWLSLCFADPYKLNIRFDTLRTLATGGRAIDFIVLLAMHMNAQRFMRHLYLRPEDRTIEQFVGDPEWRIEWAEAERRGWSPVRFLTDKYMQQMARIDFRGTSVDNLAQVRSHRKGKNRLYYLAFFSRHPRGMDFWQKALKYPAVQTELL